MKNRKISFHPDALDDLKYWIKADRKTALRILELIGDINSNPFQGIGKPEPLKQNLKGFVEESLLVIMKATWDDNYF